MYARDRQYRGGVLFSSDPELSFGDSSGRSVEGLGIGGFVEILAVVPGDANSDGNGDAMPDEVVLKIPAQLLKSVS